MILLRPLCVQNACVSWGRYLKWNFSNILLNVARNMLRAASFVNCDLLALVHIVTRREQVVCFISLLISNISHFSFLFENN